MLIQCTEVLYAFKIDEVAKNNPCLQNLFPIDSSTPLNLQCLLDSFSIIVRPNTMIRQDA